MVTFGCLSWQRVLFFIVYVRSGITRRETTKKLSKVIQMPCKIWRSTTLVWTLVSGHTWNYIMVILYFDNVCNFEDQVNFLHLLCSCLKWTSMCFIIIESRCFLFNYTSFYLMFDRKQNIIIIKLPIMIWRRF